MAHTVWNTVTSPSQGYSSAFSQASQTIHWSHLHSWVEKGTVRGNCIAQEHNTVANLHYQLHVVDKTKLYIERT